MTKSASKDYADCSFKRLQGLCLCQSAPRKLATDDRRYPARAVLSQQGDNTRQINILREGWAIRYRLLPDGGRRIITFYLPGDTINIASLFQDRNTHSLQAITPVRLCAFDLTAFRDWSGTIPAINAVSGQLIGGEIAGLQNRVANLSARSGLEAIASLFLDIHTRLRQRDMAADDGFSCPITQEHIADSVGLTKVHVSRTLSILRKEGLLEFKNQDVSFLNMEGLRQITGFADIGET